MATRSKPDARVERTLLYAEPSYEGQGDSWHFHAAYRLQHVKPDWAGESHPLSSSETVRVIVHVDHKSPADPERVGGAFGGARGPDAEQRGEQNGCGNGSAHGPAITPVGPIRKGCPGPMVSLAPHSTETLGGGNLMTP